MYGNRYGCMMPSFTSVEAGERNLRLEREPFERERPDAESVNKRRSLAGPRTVVQLIERDDGALRHPRDESFDRAFRRLVEVEIQIQQRDDQVRILVEVLGNGTDRVALDELDLRD